VLERTRWQDRELHDVKLQLIFDEGIDQERAVLRDLATAGITCIEQQSSFAFPEQDLTGHIDAMILESDGGTMPLEIKSCSPYIFDSLNTIADFQKKSWHRAYLAQINLYLLAKGKDRGLFLLKNKSTGALKQIEVSLDYDLTEKILRAAERINAHIKAGTLPERIADVEVCKGCPMRLVCAPGQKWGEEMAVADDPEFEKRLDMHFELSGPRSDYEDNYKIIASRVKATAKGQAVKLVIGKYVVEGKPDSRGAMRITIEKP
jgi:CRISPR/Cas system-associated exonuclease Cas4 (RecB family)